jgi:hypothetical protein
MLHRLDQWAFTALGPVLPANTEVWVCNQPSTTDQGYQVVTEQGVQRVVGNLPSNVAVAYGDVYGVQQVQQPLNLDSVGHCFAYLTGGFYTIYIFQCTGSRATTLNARLYLTLADQFLGSSAVGAPSS